MEENRSARAGQVAVYFGKCFRIFRHEKGWKVILFGAVISAIIAWVPGDNMFVNKVETRNGAFAIICACIWIGLFNSIQSICRERKIIKREHRTGLHISSYILAHMLYELCICLIQSVIMVAALLIFRKNFPSEGVLMPGILEIYISCLLVMYASDVLGIAVSSFVKSENAAMAAMPFVLIVQLVLAGIIFELSGSVKTVSNITISKWGVEAISATCDINNMPDAFTLLQEEEEKKAIEEANEQLEDTKEEARKQSEANGIVFDESEYEPQEIDEDEIRDKYLDKQKKDKERTDAAFNHKPKNILLNWGVLAGFTVLYGIISVIALEFVDKDKR